MKDLYSFLHHLKACPHEFMEIPLSVADRKIHTHALLADLYRRIYGDFAVTDDKLLADNAFWQRSENEVISIQIGIWFFSQPDFYNHPLLIKDIHAFLFTSLPEVCEYVKYTEWIDDEDRAEEFVRLALFSCNLQLEGETVEESADRFDALSTLKRRQVLAESNESIERIKEVRRKMAEQKAREAANVYGRE